MNLLFNEKYEGHLSTSARFEENIALAGILAAHNMGTQDGPRPDGKSFNPYVLSDEELEECKRLLIKQKGLLVNRWNDEDTLERLLRAQVVWASPEWSGIYRRIHFDKLDGKSDLNMRHVLKPTEGGLGWVDQWSITSGVTDSEKLEIAHKWIDFRLEREAMKTVAVEIGWAPHRRRSRHARRALCRHPVPERDRVDPRSLSVRRAFLAREVGAHLVGSGSGLSRKLATTRYREGSGPTVRSLSCYGGTSCRIVA